MGLISGIFTWPLTLPVRGLIRLAELIQEQVERETRNPATVRRKLEEIEAMRAAERDLRGGRAPGGRAGAAHGDPEVKR